MVEEGDQVVYCVPYSQAFVCQCGTLCMSGDEAVACFGKQKNLVVCGTKVLFLEYAEKVLDSTVM